MTDEELITKLAAIQKDCEYAMKQSDKAYKLASENRIAITSVENRAKSVEHRVNALEGKIDTILDRLAQVSMKQGDAQQSSEKIRKNTAKVLGTLIAAIVIQVIQYIF